MTQGFADPVLLAAPVHMVVDSHHEHSLLISQLVLAVAVTIFVVLRSSRETRVVNLTVLLAAALAFPFEAFADAMLKIWHPTGQLSIITAYGHSVPLWVPLVFYWVIGGQAVWMLARLRQGAGVAQLWRLYALFALTNFSFEMPALMQGSYAYFGNQPLMWPPYLPMPLYFPFGNGLVRVGLAVSVFMAERHLAARQRPWILLPLGVGVMFATLTWYGWAPSLALYGDVSAPVGHLAGLASIALSLLAMWIVTRVFGVSAMRLPAD